MNQMPIDILKRSRIATLVVDDEGAILLFNAGAEALWQRRAEEVQGRKLATLLPAYTDGATGRPQLKPGAFLLVRDAKGRQHPMRVLTDTQQHDGRTLHTLFLYDDPVTGMQSTALDAVMQARPLHDTLQRLCADLEQLMPDSRAILLLADERGRLHHPIAPEDTPPELLKAYGTLEASGRTDICSMAASTGDDLYAGDISGHPHYIHCRRAAVNAGMRSCSALPVKSDSSAVLAVLALLSSYEIQYRPDSNPLVRTCLQFCRIALEREKTREHIHHLTFYDSSTGLPNRSMLQSSVTRLLYRHRHSALPLSLLLIKLHDINRAAAAHTDDSIDSLRQALIRRIQNATRQSDITGIIAVDKIVIVLPCCSTQQALAAAERFLHELRKPVLLDDSLSYQSNISIGIAASPDDSDDFDTLVRHASVAMQYAADDSRQSIRVFQPDMNQVVQERLRLENDLRDALRTNKLHMHYQPQVGSDPDTGLLGLEALTRWQHPELGNIPPAKFIPLAEESDLIDDIAFWTMDHACRQLAQWRSRGLPIPRVAVNLSAVNLQNPGLPGKVAAILSACKLQPCDLTLEITESAVLHPDQTIGINVSALHDLGILLSLDDFGTGYSSLSHLHHLPIQELKLDSSFISDLEHSTTAQILTRSILQLAENLGLHVVAEGVETEKQREFLQRQHCNALQGYLISRPLPPAELERWLARQG